MEIMTREGERERERERETAKRLKSVGKARLLIKTNERK
jgi:hypothetical protein